MEKFRLAHLGEYERVVQIFEEAMEALHSQGIQQWNGGYPNRQLLREDIEKGEMWALEENGELLAVVVLNDSSDVDYDTSCFTAVERPLLVHRLCVVPDKQGQGVGGRMMMHCEAWARMEGYEALRLEAYSANGPALRLYDKLGYQDRFLLREPFGDFVLYEKVLGGRYLRKARLEELDGILEMYQRGIQGMIGRGIDQWDDTYPNRAILEEDIRNKQLFVFVEDGILAAAALNEEQDLEYQKLTWEYADPSLVIHRLLVDPDCQGQGVGRALMASIEEYARHQGYASIRLDTYIKNYLALNLYDSMGYGRRGILKFPFHHGEFQAFEKVL